MWCKKTQNELRIDKINKEIKKKDIKTPTVVAAIASCVILIWEQTVVIFCSTFIICFFLSYIGQVFFNDPIFFVTWIFSGNPTPDKEQFGICIKCKNTYTMNNTCPCGGEIESIEYWKWVDD